MIKDKLVSLSDFLELIRGKEFKHKKLVMTNGCFDIIHAGHVDYLEKSKELGDFLIVAINSDVSVKSIKGNDRPIIPQKYRMKVLAGLESVDYVIPFDESTPYEIINAINPDVLVKGADWRDKGGIVGSDIVEMSGGEVEYIEMIDGLSTTNVIQRILELHNDGETHR